MSTTLNSLLPPESNWSGWFDAPAPFGRTEYTLTIQIDYVDGSITGRGSDKRGEFEITGKISVSGEVEEPSPSPGGVFPIEFEKCYIDRSKGTEIYYKGVLVNDENKGVVMTGKYTYLYKMGFFKLNVCEMFEMIMLS